MTNPTLIIAFGWTQLPMLGWLLVAAAPLVIHLLSRRRYRERDWAAMHFLQAAMRESRRRLRFEHLLLLVTRTLLIVLLVLAVAGPHMESNDLLFVPSGIRTHRVLVLDGSYSMGYTLDGTSRFKHAKELAEKIVRASPRGDGFSLILMSNPPRVLVDVAALDPDEFLRELESLQCTDGTFNLAATLEKIESVLRVTERERPGLEHHEVFFLTDLCRVGWSSRTTGPSNRESIARAKQLARQARMVVIDLGQPDADNAALTRLKTVRSHATLAKPVELEIALHNFGHSGQKNKNLELFIDDRHVAHRTIDLPGNKTRVVRFSHRFEKPGEHVVEARLESDRLPVDNRRWLVLPVRRAIDVLCVDGRPGGEQGGSSDYLVTALAPGEGNHLPSWVSPTVVPESALREVDLSPYDCVFLCNVARLTATEARVLGQFIRAGGGLVIFLGDRVLARTYNEELFQKARLLPARLRGIVENSRPGLDPLNYEHEIVEPFRGREKAGLITTPVEKYFKLSIPQKTKARVALATRSGDPLIVEQPVGRGRVVLVATSADTSWTAAPLWPSYVPIVQETLAYAIAGRLAERNVAVGEPLEGTIPISAMGKNANVLLPDGREQALLIHGDAGQRTWRFNATEQSGVYKVRFDSTSTEQACFGVDVNTRESNLSKLSEKTFSEDVWPGVPFDFQTTWQDESPVAVEPNGRRGNMAVWLLYGVLGLLLIDTLLSWRFGHNTTPQSLTPNP